MAIKKREINAPKSEVPNKRSKTNQSKAPVQDSKTNQSKDPLQGNRHQLRKITIEHCTSWQSYGRDARKQVSVLAKEFNTKAERDMNSKTPRNGAYEVTVTREDGKSKQIWSGVNAKDKGKKFPSSDELVARTKKFLN